MDIILLSGGSGKRLWPLSNDVRSKQFIKLFKNDAGEYESMLQRVYRQIRRVDPHARITIATSKSQVSAIKNQLGDNVSVCVEPVRRDTFPAIALASLYLRDELGVKQNDPVIVCPVDPFVEDSYYESFQHLEELVIAKREGLTLMGIVPTYPSDKYGYIIPSDGQPVSQVVSFKEKPDTEQAKKYLAQNALWNAGIFGFTLGYMTQKTAAITGMDTFDELVAQYATLPKKSFDYAVVEEEPDIQALRYDGAWKDVGTWNMMSEVMADRIKGNAIMDDTSENTNIVNELGIPLLCLGGKNLIVVASEDGILVSDKERSGYMKPYVEQIETEVKFAEKSWGQYRVIDDGEGYRTARLSIDADAHLSYHAHRERTEILTVISGEGQSLLDGKMTVLSAGDTLTITEGEKHSIIATTEMEIIETQIGDAISVEDKDKYAYDFESGVE